MTCRRAVALPVCSLLLPRNRKRARVFAGFRECPLVSTLHGNVWQWLALTGGDQQPIAVSQSTSCVFQVRTRQSVGRQMNESRSPGVIWSVALLLTVLGQHVWTEQPVWDSLGPTRRWG